MTSGASPSRSTTTRALSHTTPFGTPQQVSNDDLRLHMNETSPPRRRVTRSQSKEVEGGLVNALRHGGARDGGNLGVASTTDQNAAPSKRSSLGLNDHGRVRKSERLTAVIEESPTKSLQRHGRPSLQQVNPSRPGLDYDDGEDPHNMSGTTILPTDSEPETVDLDPVMATEVLQALQRAATGIMDSLVPPATEPAQITSMAKRLRDPKNTLNRRLNRHLANLKEEAEYFTKQTYIDVGAVKKVFPSTVAVAGGKQWTPDLIVHLANCSRLAADVLLAAGSTSTRQVINSLEGTFPVPFMNGFNSHGTATAGMSSLEKGTFDVGLDIRTQFFRLKLEERQSGPEPDPESILRGVFYDEQLLDDDGRASVDSEHADRRHLRGIGMPPYQDENGRLPEEFQDDVLDRIDDIMGALSDEDGGHTNIAGVNMAFSWQRFTHRLIRWVRRRYDEISADMKTHPSLDEVRRALESRPEQTVNVVEETQRSPEGHAKGLQKPAERVAATDPTTTRAVESNEANAGPTVEQRSVTEHGRLQPDVQSKSSTRRRSSKRVDAETIERLSARWNATTRPDEDHERRKSDPMSLPSKRANSPRRETLSALPHSSLRYAEEPPEIPESPEVADRSRVTDSDDDGHVIVDSQWDKGDETVQTAVDVAGPSQGFDGSTLAEIPGQSFASESSTSRSREAAASGLPLPSGEIWKAITQTTVQSPSPGRTSASTTTKTPVLRTFIDRQADAQRVSPISERPSTERRKASPPAAPAPTPFERKRRRREPSDPEDFRRVGESHDTDDDESDVFAQDDRGIDVSQRRGQKPAQKRRRVLLKEDDESPIVEDAAATQLLTEYERAQRTATASESPPRHAEAARETSTAPPAARVRRRVSESPELEPGSRSPPKGRGRPQRRKRWTLAEEKRLIKLIERYACSWARIKEVDDFMSEDRGGPQLQDRDQVALKDKARNIKLDYLRQGVKPHENFKHVSIGKREERQFEDVLREWGWARPAGGAAS